MLHLKRFSRDTQVLIAVFYSHTVSAIIMTLTETTVAYCNTENHYSLQRREKEDLERKLQAGLEEEEKFVKLLKELKTEAIMKSEKHPFRRVLERHECLCPPNPFGMIPF